MFSQRYLKVASRHEGHLSVIHIQAQGGSVGTRTHPVWNTATYCMKPGLPKACAFASHGCHMHLCHSIVLAPRPLWQASS